MAEVSYPARCIQIIDLGLQEKTWQGETKLKPEIILIFETAERMQDERPFTVNRRFTKFTTDKANFAKFLIDWGVVQKDALDSLTVDMFLNKTCLLSVTATPSNDTPNRIFNNIQTVMPLPKGMEIQEAENPVFEFSIKEIGDEEKMKKIWPWIQKIIKKSQEYLILTGEEPPF